jgi:septal ring factor EnvC (AmiA/AmiB activator)
MKKISLVIAILFCFALLSPSVFAVSESDLLQQKQEAQDKADAAQYQIDMTQTTVEGITSEIKKADAKISELQGQVNTLSGQIDQLNQSIASNQSDLDAMNVTLSGQQKDLEERLRVMYMYGNETYLEILFSAKDLGDFMAKADMVASIMRADQGTVNTVKETVRQMNEKNQAIASQKSAIETAQQTQQAALASQQNIKSQENTLLAQNSAVLQTAQANLAESQAEMAQADAGLAEIARQRGGAAAAAPTASEEPASDNSGSSSGDSGSASSGSTSSGGGGASSTGYIWPCDSHEITDYFGYRESTGVESTYHQGLDIGASSGSPIYAAAAGRVILAEWHWGYGNCVMIAHDDGYTTLYGHQSAIAVSEGDYVSQGQVIGYVGSTGNSTGPHLHISFIDSDGNFVDPLNFI